MSDTAHVIHHLSEYLDHALTAQERHAVEKHLEHCKECSVHFKELQHLRQRLKAAPELTPPESFYQGVLEQIERDKKPFLIWDWPMTTKAIATFGVVMVVVMVAREARRSEPELFAPVSPAAAPEAAPAAPVSVAQPATPVALQSKTLRKAMGASSVASDEKKGEENKDVDQLASAARARESAPAADKALDLSGASGAPVAAASMNNVGGKVALQARDINGPATQGSFAEGQQLPAKKEISATLSTAPSAAAPAQTTEWKGGSSAIASFRTAVITSDADWKALWAQHQQNQVPPPPAPAVDFSRYTAVAVFEGSKPSSGYAVAITDIETGPETITVNYREQAPAAGTVNATVMTQPYDIRLIPKTSLPVTFIKQP